MFIASICFNRGEVAGKRFIPFGSIFQRDDRSDRLSIKFSGLRIGPFTARPFDNVAHPPLIEGDLMVWTGDYISEGKKRYQWVGHIHTNPSQDGGGDVKYYGNLEILPLQKMDDKGLWVSIFLNDDKRADPPDFGDNDDMAKPVEAVKPAETSPWPVSNVTTDTGWIKTGPAATWPSAVTTTTTGSDPFKPDEMAVRPEDRPSEDQMPWHSMTADDINAELDAGAEDDFIPVDQVIPKEDHYGISKLEKNVVPF